MKCTSWLASLLRSSSPSCGAEAAAAARVAVPAALHESPQCPTNDPKSNLHPNLNSAPCSCDARLAARPVCPLVSRSLRPRVSQPLLAPAGSCLAGLLAGLWHLLPDVLRIMVACASLPRRGLQRQQSSGGDAGCGSPRPHAALQVLRRVSAPPHAVQPACSLSPCRAVLLGKQPGGQHPWRGRHTADFSPCLIC